MSNIFVLLFYILFLSKFLHVLRCGICFGQVFYLQLRFDPGASHSFMSESYALRHGVPFEEMFSPMIIQTPGSKWQTSRVSHVNEIAIEGLVFLASLIALKSSDIDVILGMDWLSRQNAYLDCKAKSVKLTHPSGQIID